MRKYCGYTLLTRPDIKGLKSIMRYSAGSYAVAVLNTAPIHIIPSLLLSYQGSTSSAYFAIAWAMAGMLYILPNSLSQSLLAESSNDESKHGSHVRQVAKLLAPIVIVASALAYAIAPYILAIFGSDYVAGAEGLFRLLALATGVVAINEVLSTHLRVQTRVAAIATSAAAAAIISIVSAVYVLHTGYGLVGVGYAIVTGYVVNMLMLASFTLFGRTTSGKRPLFSKRVALATQAVNLGS